MKFISSEQPPEEVEPVLKEYLSRMLGQVNFALRDVNRMPKIYVLPDKPQDGQLAYFGQIIGATITSVGFWGYEAGTWVKL